MTTTLWPQSGVLQHELTVNQIAFGATVEFFDGGTTIPKVVYQDSSENVSFGSVVEVDQYGRWPNIFVPTGAPYRYRILSGSAAASQIHFADNIPNPDPAPGSSEPAPAETVETATIRGLFQTGEKTGWVRANGRTIGNAGSLPSPTERENADTEDLFKYFWNNLDNDQAPLGGGSSRGASADADWSAGRTITLPDMRGRTMVGLDDMGASAAGRYPPYIPFSNGTATTVGSVGGYNGTGLSQAQLPTHSHVLNVTTDAGSGDHSHSINITSGNGGNHDHGSPLTSSGISVSHQHAFPKAVATSADTAGVQAGGSTAIGNVSFENLTTASQNQDHTHSVTIPSSGTHTHPVVGDTASASPQYTISNQSTNTVGFNEGVSTITGFALITYYIKL